jgi:hypothetical protein
MFFSIVLASVLIKNIGGMLTWLRSFFQEHQNTKLLSELESMRDICGLL